MAVICPARPCALQNPADKTFSEGMLYVFPSLVRFVPKAGQRLEIQVGNVTGVLPLCCCVSLPLESVLLSTNQPPC